MIPFKGRIYFRQYIPSKRARFGIKAFVMAEAKSGYVCELQIYTGARLNEEREVNLSGRVVRELMVHKHNIGHHLYTDNYYIKVPMIQEQYEQKVIIFVRISHQFIINLLGNGVYCFVNNNFLAMGMKKEGYKN